MDFDYKKYSLENLENWMHDAMSSGGASPQEIYDIIVGVVKDNYYTYKHQTSQAYELLALLNGNGKGHLSCDRDDQSEECKKSWTSFWEENYYPEEYKEPKVEDIMPPWGHSDMEALRYSEEELNAMCEKAELDELVKQVKEEGGYGWTPEKSPQKWIIPIEVDGPSGEYFVVLPDDLLVNLKWKEGDQLQWIDNQDGSFKLERVPDKNA